MATQSIIQAIRGIDYMIRQLEFLAHELKYRLVTEPDKILADSVSLGFPVEIEKRYRNGYMVKNEEDVKMLLIDIKMHIQYLQQVIEKLKNALNV